MNAEAIRDPSGNYFVNIPEEERYPYLEAVGAFPGDLRQASPDAGREIVGEIAQGHWWGPDTVGIVYTASKAAGLDMSCLQKQLGIAAEQNGEEKA